MSKANPDKRALWSWAVYDFANSAFTTIIVTFVYSAFFVGGIALDETTGNAQWADAVTVSAILIALLSPFLGAVADQGGHRKRFVVTFTTLAILGSVGLYFPMRGDVLLALSIFVFANVSFEMANVFYNAYLPDLTTKENIGRVSGRAWALGYTGGLVCLGFALVAFMGDVPWFGLSTEDAQNFRAIPILVAVWYAVFSIPFLIFVKDPPTAPRPVGEVVTAAGRQLKRTFEEVKRYRQVVRMLLARMFYNDGITTVFALGSVYAITVFGFTIDEITLWGIALNVSAAIGAFAMGSLDDKIGGKRTIQITNVGLALTVFAGAVVQTKAAMWAVGIVLGLFVGPNQSASRSLLGRFVPQEKETEFYGFFAFSGKATAFIGPWMYAMAVRATGNPRLAIGAVVGLFVIGALLLARVDEEEGFRGAQAT